MGLSTHILDLITGQPAADIEVKLFFADAYISTHTTDADGRCMDMLEDDFSAGSYRLEFDVADYFKALDRDTFYSIIPVVFQIEDTVRRYHVPLLLSPYGYSTYRGS